MVNIYPQLILRRVGGGDAELAKYAGFVRQSVKRMDALIFRSIRVLHLYGS